MELSRAKGGGEEAQETQEELSPRGRKWDTFEKPVNKRALVREVPTEDV